jgi:hypothetical protein
MLARCQVAREPSQARQAGGICAILENVSVLGGRFLSIFGKMMDVRRAPYLGRGA